MILFIFQEKYHLPNKIPFGQLLQHLESEIMMLKIVEIFQQKGTDHQTFLIVSCSIYSFLT